MAKFDLYKEPKLQIREDGTEEVYQIDEENPVKSKYEALLKPIKDLLPPEATLFLCNNTRSYKSVINAEPLAECYLCHEKVWISPSGRSMLSKATPVCLECVAKHTNLDDLVQVVREDQRAEEMFVKRLMK